MKSISLTLLSALLASNACKGESSRYDHTEDHPSQHDHHEEDHGHGGTSMIWITTWSEQFELFAEHPPAVAGEAVSFLAHVTVLNGFRPLETGVLRLRFRGPTSIDVSADTPVRAGIYRLGFTPPSPGLYRGELEIEGNPSGTIGGFSLTVFESHEAANRARLGETETEEEHSHEDRHRPTDDHQRQIEFLKEQQWGIPFDTAFAEIGSLAASTKVAGTVETPPDGLAEVGAPVAGRIAAPDDGLPRPGDSVEEGDLLAALVPAPSSPEEAARANLAVAEAEARTAAARTALARAERLIQDEAISQRELEDARREAEVAAEAVRAARRSAGLFSGARTGRSSGAWQLVAPIPGIVTDVHANPGASVSPGDVLFRIVDDRELWIRARVPEQDAARLRSDRDAHYRVVGLDRWVVIDITDEDATASLIMMGRTVDQASRTVDVIYALRNPDAALRVGGLVEVSLPAGEDFGGIVVPESAIVNEEGRQLVYVQVDGEHFAERHVRIGPRAGGRVGIRDGIEANERIVILGAHLVRLADRASSSAPHGHIH